jgi:hypothetical protein
VEIALKKLTIVISERLVFWDIHEQKALYEFRNSKEYLIKESCRNGLKSVLPKKQMKDILDFLFKYYLSVISSQFSF